MERELEHKIFWKKEKTYEKLDIYNENRIKTGKIIERKENT